MRRRTLDRLPPLIAAWLSGCGLQSFSDRNQDTAAPLELTFEDGANVKERYSPWTGSDLHEQLCAARVDTIIVTGGETDVCVLATVLGAVDWGRHSCY